MPWPRETAIAKSAVHCPVNRVVLVRDRLTKYFWKRPLSFWKMLRKSKVSFWKRLLSFWKMLRKSKVSFWKRLLSFWKMFTKSKMWSPAF